MKTVRLKVKAEDHSWLNAASREVNFVWNWANETSEKAIRRFTGPPKWLTGYDLEKLTVGAYAEFKRIKSDTISVICQEFARKRRAARKSRLKWRRSGGSKRSLGWVPFKGYGIRRKGNAIRFCGKTFRVFNPEMLDGLKMRMGCFAQDACGDWWFCTAVDAAQTDNRAPREAVGIDLGLKTVATTSDGETTSHHGTYHALESKLAQAQRRGHKRRAKLIHRKIANQRKDALHKFSRGIINNYQNIFIGDVSSSKLKRTRMAKSVSDSGWFMLKTQLQYKGQQAGRRVEIVNEAYTTRACSSCGCLSGPGGLRQLAVRSWRCSECGAEHDRDINAAKNIAKVGLRYQPPSAGTGTSKTHGYRHWTPSLKELMP